MNVIKPRRRALSKEELSWFDLSKYAAGKLPVAPAGWVPIIAARAHLLTWLRADYRYQVLALLPGLQDNPAADLGFDFLGSRGVHRLDRPSVRLVSMSMLSGMGASAKAFGVNPDPDASFDEELGKHTADDRLARFAHVRIDFAATRSQICKDFDRWLGDMTAGGGLVTSRPYDHKTIAGWVSKKYLPFADLHIFAEAHERRISPRTYLDLLDLDDGVSGLDRDLIKPQIRALSEVISHDTERALHLAAGTTRRSTVNSWR